MSFDDRLANATYKTIEFIGNIPGYLGDAYKWALGAKRLENRGMGGLATWMTDRRNVVEIVAASAVFGGLPLLITGLSTYQATRSTVASFAAAAAGYVAIPQITSLYAAGAHDEERRMYDEMARQDKEAEEDRKKAANPENSSPRP